MKKAFAETDLASGGHGTRVGWMGGKAVWLAARMRVGGCHRTGQQGVEEGGCYVCDGRKRSRYW